MLQRLGYAILALVMTATALLCFQTGFDRLAQVRQLDRLPVSPVSALTQGLYALGGRLESNGSLITAPYSGEAVIYYRFKLEEEYRDSEGNRKTRTLDSGSSLTAFVLADDSGQVGVDPGYQISNITINAPRTHRRQQGDRIFTEYTLQPGDRVEILGQFDYRSQRFNLSPTDIALQPILTTDTLKKEGGDSLLFSSLLISVAAAALAVGLAAVLVVFQVHRYWVFVVVMTAGLLISLWSIGLWHLQQDWHNAGKLYQTRFKATSVANSSAAEKDLYAFYLLHELSADQWPDSLLFKLAARTTFRPPAVEASVAESIRQQVISQRGSHIENRGLAMGISVGAALFTLFLIVVALRAIRFKRLVEFVPTSVSTGLSYGIAELFGMIDVDDQQCPPLLSKLNGEKCVAYRYQVEERRGSGKKAKWVTLDSGAESSHFWLEDPYGKVKVNPENIHLRYPEKRIRREGRKRYSEYWLPPFRNVYCLGFAGIADADSDRLSIQNSDDFYCLITTQEEQQVVQNEGAKGFMLTGLALGFSLLAGTVLIAASGMLMPLDLIKVSLLVPVTLLFITMILHYNGLVFLRNRVTKTRADIDTLLQKRHDLWPQLLSTVQGLMAHEKKLMAAMAKLRSGQAAYSENPTEMQRQLQFEEKVVAAFQARLEAYPELKSNQLVQTFSKQMQRSEEELALIRQGYNDSVELYNTQIEKLPDVILARLFGFKAEMPFQRLE